MGKLFKTKSHPVNSSGRIRPGISRNIKLKLPALTGIVILTLIIVGTALAFTLGNTDGVWSTIDGGGGATCDTWATGPGNNPTSFSTSFPSVQTPPNTDENQVRYGDPVNDSTLGDDDRKLEFAQQSGFGFDGQNGSVSPAADTPFYLGKFTPYNNPISADNSFYYVDLAITVPVTCNNGVTTTSFNFTPRFELDETPNSSPCAYPGSSTCPDKVTVTQPTNQSFTCPDGNYTVNILGFTTEGLGGAACDQSFNPAAVATEFITEEQTDNEACLWAEITRPDADITPDKTCANFNDLNPVYRIETTNLGPGSATGAQIVDTIPTVVSIVGDPWYSSELIKGGRMISQGTCSKVGQTVTCQLLTSLPSTTADPTAVWTVEIHVAHQSAEFPISNTVNASMTTFDTNLAKNSDTCISEFSTGINLASFDLVLQPDRSMLVSWETVIEENIAEFNVYHSIDPAQTGQKLNRMVIVPLALGQPFGAVYSEVDTGETAGQTYYYRLGVLENGSGETLFGPNAITIPLHRLYLPVATK